MKNNTNFIILSIVDHIEEDMSANNDCVRFTIHLKDLLVQGYQNKSLDFEFDAESLVLHRSIDFQFEEDRLLYNYISAFCRDDEVGIIASPQLYYTGMNEQGILDTVWGIKIHDLVNDRLGPLGQGCDIQ